MSLAVIDASVLVAFYAADDPHHSAVAARLSAETHCSHPHTWTSRSSRRCVALLVSTRDSSGSSPMRSRTWVFPIRRMPTPPLLERIWELRHNTTAYDAAYVALAERLDAVLVTCDTKLANASGPRCSFDQIA